jgi:prolyl-tRNA synthetase
LRNVNFGRDFTADVVADIASASPGAPCPNCGAPLRMTRGVEVGNIFQLGTRYTAALGANFLDILGQQRPIVMGSYGIGVGRTLACIAEQHRDERGLIMPITVAPFEAHLVRLNDGDTAVDQAADSLYGQLQAAGIDTLDDDRDSSPGSKFADADLIGTPMRITISKRSLSKGGVELKTRAGTSQEVVPLHDALAAVQELRKRLFAEAAGRVRQLRYDGSGQMD